MSYLIHNPFLWLNLQSILLLTPLCNWKIIQGTHPQHHCSHFPSQRPLDSCDFSCQLFLLFFECGKPSFSFSGFSAFSSYLKLSLSWHQNIPERSCSQSTGESAYPFFVFIPLILLDDHLLCALFPVYLGPLLGTTHPLGSYLPSPAHHPAMIPPPAPFLPSSSCLHSLCLSWDLRYRGQGNGVQLGRSWEMMQSGEEVWHILMGGWICIFWTRLEELPVQSCKPVKTAFAI